ncbi:MAG: hypothetical protein A2X23_02400 [Chloroflexi bacterium GWC2_73_18]|nr:MAG: hypothetical protein A2X23_02400 [Chloroflexi bacterium GWC2_73_18]
MTTNKAEPPAVAPLPRRRRDRFDELLADGYDVAIDGAVSYRLTDAARAITVGVYETARPAFQELVEQVAGGRDPADFALECADASGAIRPVSRGAVLLGLARGALGLPRSATG